jgi:tetratricopeptide (TPR) repeat protein
MTAPPITSAEKSTTKPTSSWPYFHMALLFVLGFILSSTFVTNVDIWLRLDAGQNFFVQGFAEKSWSSLFEIIATLGLQILGEKGLVIAKAVLVGISALILFISSDGRRSPWSASFATTLCLIAVANMFSLQLPLMVYLCLPISMYLASRYLESRSWKQIAFFAIILLIWSNSNRSVVNQLFITLLMCVGALLDSLKASSQSANSLSANSPSAKKVGLAIVAILAVTGLAIFANPGFFANGFVSPVEWVNFPKKSVSPISLAYFKANQENPNIIAFYALALFSIVVVIANFKKHPRFFELTLPWLASLIAVAYDEKWIPIFSMIATPVLGQFLANHPSVSNRKPTLFFKATLTLIGLAVLVAAWPGWLQNKPYQSRNWGFDLPKSPAQATEYLLKEPDAPTLFTSEAARRIFRWHGVKGSFNSEIINSLDKPDALAKQLKAGNWKRLVCYHPERSTLNNLLMFFVVDQDNWSLVAESGDVWVFESNVVNPEAKKKAISIREWHSPKRDAQSEKRDAQSEKQDTLPGSLSSKKSDLQEAFAVKSPAMNLDRDRAAMLLTVAKESKKWETIFTQRSIPFEQWIGFVGSSAANWSALPMLSADITLRNSVAVPFDAESKPTSTLIDTAQQVWTQTKWVKGDCYENLVTESIRSSRDALKQNPNDPEVLFNLGEAYRLHMDSTSERGISNQFRKVAELRQTQAVTALTASLKYESKYSSQTHATLSRMYRGIDFWDLSFEHAQKSRELDKKMGREFIIRDEEYKVAEKENESRVTAFAKAAEGKLVGQQVTIARNHQLPGKALKLLLNSDISAFGKEGLRHEVELLTRTGRTKELLDWLNDEQTKLAMGESHYYWFLAQVYSAEGNYTKAEESLRLIVGIKQEKFDFDAKLLMNGIGNVISSNVLNETPTIEMWNNISWQYYARITAIKEMTELEKQLNNLAEVSLLIAYLKLEQGSESEAMRYLELALDFSPILSNRETTLVRQIASKKLNSLKLKNIK